MRDQSFHCHETVDYSDDSGEGRVTTASEECAGAVIVLEKMGRANQMMRIAERLGWYDRAKMKMRAPVFDNLRQFIEHHEGPMTEGNVRKSRKARRAARRTAAAKVTMTTQVCTECQTVMYHKGDCAKLACPNCGRIESTATEPSAWRPVEREQ